MRRSNGIALLSALYFLIIIGVLVSGAFYAAHLERSGANARVDDAALVAAADLAATGPLADWRSEIRDSQTVGSTATLPLPIASALSTSDSVSVTRLTPSLFWLVGEAQASQAGEVRRVNLIVQLPTAAPAVSAALVSAGSVSLGPGAHFVTSPEGRCRAPHDTAAIVLAPGMGLTVDAPTGTAAVPYAVTDPLAADSSTYRLFGAVTWEWLAANADRVFTSGGTVVLTGDSSRPQVLYAPGDLAIRGGSGAGILLVGGHLRLGGPLRFNGLVVVRNGMETVADSVVIGGAVLSESAVALRHVIELRSSTCSLALAIATHAVPRAVPQRAWAELY